MDVTISVSTVQSFNVMAENPTRTICSCLAYETTIGDAYLYRLETRPEYRNRGLAAELVRAVIDHYDCSIRLAPCAYNDEPMSSDQLRDWYGRLGFVTYDPVPEQMIYKKFTKRSIDDADTGRIGQN